MTDRQWEDESGRGAGLSGEGSGSEEGASRSSGAEGALEHWRLRVRYSSSARRSQLVDGAGGLPETEEVTTPPLSGLSAEARERLIDLDPALSGYIDLTEVAAPGEDRSREPGSRPGERIARGARRSQAEVKKASDTPGSGGNPGGNTALGLPRPESYELSSRPESAGDFEGILADYCSRLEAYSQRRRQRAEEMVASDLEEVERFLEGTEALDTPRSPALDRALKLSGFVGEDYNERLKSAEKLWKWRYERGSERRRREAEAAEQRAVEVEERYDAEKRRWARESGSRRLGQLLDSGYDADIPYARERAATEAGGFVPLLAGSTGQPPELFRHPAPPTEVLREAQQTAEFLNGIHGEGAVDSEVVRAYGPELDPSLREAARESREARGVDGDESIPGEGHENEDAALDAGVLYDAILLRGYLGEYDLVRVLEPEFEDTGDSGDAPVRRRSGSRTDSRTPPRPAPAESASDAPEDSTESGEPRDFGEPPEEEDIPVEYSNPDASLNLGGADGSGEENRDERSSFEVSEPAAAPAGGEHRETFEEDEGSKEAEGSGSIFSGENRTEGEYAAGSSDNAGGYPQMREFDKARSRQNPEKGGVFSFLSGLLGRAQTRTGTSPAPKPPTARGSGGSPRGGVDSGVADEELERRLQISLREVALDSVSRLCVGSPKGGVGKSSVSYALAGTLAYYSNLRVCLVDADPNFGATRMLVPRPIEQSVLSLSEAADSLRNLSDMRSFVAKNERMRLDVILSPEQAYELARAENLAESYARVDAVLEKFYDLIIYDLGLGFRDDAIQQVLSLSDELLFVTDVEVIPNSMVEGAIRFIENLGVSLDRNSTTLILNHCLPKEDESAQASDIRDAHADLVRRITEIPYDAAMSQILNARSFHIEDLDLQSRLGILSTATACLEGLRRGGGR